MSDYLTDEEIDAVANSMEGGLDGFLKGWGWRQFARAAIEAHTAKAGAFVTLDEVSDALQSDLEHGVKCLNTRAALKFKQEYPALNELLASKE